MCFSFISLCLICLRKNRKVKKTSGCYIFYFNNSSRQILHTKNFTKRENLLLHTGTYKAVEKKKSLYKNSSNIFGGNEFRLNIKKESIIGVLFNGIKLSFILVFVVPHFRIFNNFEDEGFMFSQKKILKVFWFHFFIHNYSSFFTNNNSYTFGPF